MFDLSLESTVRELKRPIHLRVRELLRKLILEQFEDGQKFYSERDLMEKLHCSQPTVRRALVDLAAEGHLIATPRRGFFVRRRVDQRHVGILVPYIEDSSEHFIESFAGVCSLREYALHIYHTQPGELPETMVRRISHRQIEERVIMSGFATQVVQELNVRLGEIGYKSLVVGGVPSSYPGAAVSLDHAGEARSLLNYLTELGHRRILFLVNEPRELLTTSRRAHAIEAELAQRGLPEAKIIYCNTPMGGDSFTFAYDFTHAAWSQPVRPTAIIPLSGMGAWATLRYMMERNVSVPGEVSLFCFDPVTGTAFLPIPMTGFSFSQADRAKVAIELLWRESFQPIHHLIEPQLVRRASVGPPPN